MNNYEEIQKNRKDAEALENNELLTKIFNSLKAGIEDRAQKMNTAKEPELAQDIIRFKQLLNSFERTVRSLVKKGEVAQKEHIKELQKKIPIQKIFRR